MSETAYESWVRGGADLLGEIHDLAVSAAPRLKFDIARAGWPHIYAVGLYASLTEISGSCIALARAKAYVGIPILSRTCLEAFVDLKNLLADDAYVHNLEVRRYTQLIRILDEAQDGANAYVAGIASDPEFAANRKEYDAALDAAVRSGGKALSARDRFDRAGHIQEYKSLYNFLSAESHNDGRALMRRHLNMSKDPPELVMYGPEPSFVIPSLSTVAAMLMEATIWMHERFANEKINLGDLPDRAKAFDAELVSAK